MLIKLLYTSEELQKQEDNQIRPIVLTCYNSSDYNDIFKPRTTIFLYAI